MTKQNGLFIDDEDLEIIRELLSHMACGYERTEFYFHCCDANGIVEMIDKHFEEE